MDGGFADRDLIDEQAQMDPGGRGDERSRRLGR